MSHLVAVSPHLDDAAFSAGGLLASHAREGGRVTIVTCFAADAAPPAGFALACQLDQGLLPEMDCMASRRAEDVAACAVIGAAAVHLAFLEAPHRGYENAAALFGLRRADDAVADRLAPALAALLDRLAPDLLLGPLAIGDHVDHWIVRDALARTGRALLLWEDWPYLDRPAARRPADPTHRLRLDPELTARRIAMCGAYLTQLGCQFGGHAPMAARIGAIAEERFYAA